ncbi:MAG: DoxX-like family protein [Pseudomonadota bacterium]
MHIKPDWSPAAICRGAIAFVWFYHGLVPKLLGPHPDELAMIMAMGLSPSVATYISYMAGVGEIGFAACVLYFRQSEWPLWFTIVSMILLLAFVAVVAPATLMAAFNPVSLNFAVIALALVALKLQRNHNQPG